MKTKIKDNWLISLAFLLAILPTVLPLLETGFFHMHDFTHVARLTELHRALTDGHFPVRWSENFGYGYGMPLFNFYAPLPYYVANLFYGVGFSGIAAIKLLMAVTSIGAFLGTYLGVQKLWGKWAGLVAASALTLAPYRALDIYVRGALGEAAAITFMTMTVSALIYWHKQGGWKWVGLTALAWSGIALSHNLTALISFPVIFLSMIGVVMLSKDKRIKVMQGIVMVMLALGIGSFYTLPALLEKDYTVVEMLTTGYSDFRLHFLYLRQLWHGEWDYGGSVLGIDDGISFEIGKWHLILVVIALAAAWKERKKIKKEDGLTYLWCLVIIGFASLMTTFKTQWIWERVSVLEYVQFPWRFLAIVIVFVSMLAGASVRWWKTDNQKKWFALGTILVLLGLNGGKFRPVEYMSETEAIYYEDESRIKSHMSGVLPDFIPNFGVDRPTEPRIQKFELSGEEQEFKVAVDRTHEFLLSLEGSEGQMMRINQFYFPGWKIYIGDKPIEIEVSEQGLMEVRLPETRDKVWLSGRFEETPIRRIGNLTSLIALTVTAYILLDAEGKKKWQT